LDLSKAYDIGKMNLSPFSLGENGNGTICHKLDYGLCPIGFISLSSLMEHLPGFLELQGDLDMVFHYLPFFFSLWIKALSKLISNARSKGNFKGVKDIRS
jgi:hypothetical protein